MDVRLFTQLAPDPRRERIGTNKYDRQSPERASELDNEHNVKARFVECPDIYGRWCRWKISRPWLRASKVL
jgi:hypothetical protein